MINNIVDHVTKYSPITEEKIYGIEVFQKVRKADTEHRFVQCSGCFDFLHVGHIVYLEQAKRLGDKLVVTVNTDKRVIELKGRLVFTLDERLYMLASLACVDYVIPFGEDLPNEIIRKVQTHVYVKGCDYSNKDLPEASTVYEIGAAIHCLPESRTYDCTTTDIIKRIKLL